MDGFIEFDCGATGGRCVVVVGELPLIVSFSGLALDGEVASLDLDFGVPFLVFFGVAVPLMFLKLGGSRSHEISCGTGGTIFFFVIFLAVG